MNKEIIDFLKSNIANKGITYKFISETTGIDYQRLMRIFNQYATISGSELLFLGRLLKIEQEDLLKLINVEKAVC